MGNLSSTLAALQPATATATATSFDASDLLLDRMEKQAVPSQQQQQPHFGWLNSAARCCQGALVSMATALTGGLYGSLDPHKTVVSCDAACQTDKPVASLWDWQLQHLECKRLDDVDFDTRSCSTEATDLLSDDQSSELGESDCGSDYTSDAGVEDEVDNLEAALDHCDGDCETQVDRLLELTAAVCCARPSDDCATLYLEDYLCPCGQCPQYKTIARDVKASSLWRNEQQKRSITRLLQAYSTYNEVDSYRADMLSAARECLQLWLGDEDRAFASFVTLLDEVPRLCA